MITDSFHSTLHGYVDGVLSGSIVTSKAVRCAVERFQRDLARASTSEFPYHFDEPLAAKVCRFYPSVIRHSIGRYAGMPFELEPWQIFCVANIFGWLRDCDDTRRFRKTYRSMARKNGKALALDTLLPTPTGFTTMGEVQAGDYLLGPDGKPVRVLAATEVMIGSECYEVKFSTGERVVCDADHEWLTTANVQLVGCGGIGRKMGSRGQSIKTTRQIASSVVYGKRNDRNHSVLISACCNFEEKELLVAPYTLGAWLGDGSSAGARITCGYSDTEIIDRIILDGYECPEVKSSNDNSGAFSIRNAASGTRRSVTSLLRKLGVLNNKHIPLIYLRSSKSQRLELLRGLMDTDGYISKAGQCEFVSKNKRLAEDVQELVLSLGVKAGLLEHDAKLNGRFISKKYRVIFHAFQPFVPFCLSRKAARVVERKSDKSRRSQTRQIVSCQEVPSVPVRCVQVEGGMYCCTRAFIPTHNSTWIAAESIYMAGFDRNPLRGCVEPVAQVVLSASKRDQVDKVVFAEAKRMRLKSPALAKRSDFIKKEIRFPANDGEIITTGSDKPYDGLNPHSVGMDELHAWREHHREFYDTMVTGSGFRDQPLISIITTAGDDRSHLWREVYDYAKAVAIGTVQDEAFFSFIAELDEDDDPFDEANWIKANPNLGVSVSIDYLRGQATEAKTSAVGTNRFTRYHGNRLVTSVEKAFDLAAWDKCKGEVGDWVAADAVGAGVDLGARDDLAAQAQVARFVVGERDGNPVYRFEVRVKAYISEETTRDLTKSPFCEWIYRDLLQKTRYPIADLRDSLVEKCRDFGAEVVAYDPYNAQSLAEELAREGLTPLRMAQNHSMFNEPIRDFIQAVADGRVTHDGNPLLRWAVNNAQIYRDRKDLWMFDKKSSAEKIDPIVAVVMAFRVCCLAPARATGSLYL